LYHFKAFALKNGLFFGKTAQKFEKIKKTLDFSKII